MLQPMRGHILLALRMSHKVDCFAAAARCRRGWSRVTWNRRGGHFLPVSSQCSVIDRGQNGARSIGTVKHKEASGGLKGALGKSRL